jgi:hypothetical protein
LVVRENMRNNRTDIWQTLIIWECVGPNFEDKFRVSTVHLFLVKQWDGSDSKEVEVDGLSYNSTPR